jgi:Mg-chelatase subunit ChlD
LDFFDYAWATSFQITKKKHEEVKVLVRDDVDFPILGKDSSGYVICVPEPRRVSKGLISFEGLTLNASNEFHRKVLWQLFRASIYHLSLHIATSGYEAYVDWAKSKDSNLALYVANILEDAVVVAHVRTEWSPLIPDTALANTISYLRLKPAHVIFDDSLRIMAAILSNYTVGKSKGDLPRQMQKDADDIVSYLRRIEDLVSKQLDQTENQPKNPQKKEKLEIADAIYSKLHKYGRPPSALTLPYTESYSGNSVYRKNITAKEKEFNDTLEMAFTKLGSTRFIDESCEREASQAFSTWEAKMAHQQKILEGYKDLLAGTRFSAAEFPREDYTEYLRSKELLSGPIRRVLEKLRLLKNITGEDFRQESGLVDLQEAIQIIASKSQRTDIFVREEYQTREEAWAIVIDASHSLDSFLGEVRGIALCLAETAKNLILNRAAWGVFAFNDEFYIIKDFSENYSTHVRARIGGLKQKGLTYLPDGLKVAKNAMQSRIEQAKIIVAVSDFFPSGDLAIENELIQDLKQMERSGMGLIGVGVKSRAVKNYFRCNCVVETPYDLMKSFTKAFLEYSATV